MDGAFCPPAALVPSTLRAGTAGLSRIPAASGEYGEELREWQIGAGIW
jgi:hypothetical protein